MNRREMFLKHIAEAEKEGNKTRIRVLTTKLEKYDSLHRTKRDEKDE